jgi:hypothetical protein
MGIWTDGHTDGWAYGRMGIGTDGHRDGWA